jgi:hypothetical protein
MKREDIVVYIEGVAADLLPNAIVAPTIISGKVTTLSRRSVGYTNTIRFPYTEKNVKLFGFMQNEHSTSPIISTKLRCYVTSSGTQIFKGYIYIKETASGFVGNIYEPTLNFFEEVGDKVLSELNIVSVDDALNTSTGVTTWSDATMVARKKATEGLVAPFIDYGQINQADALTDVGAPGYYPCVYYHTVLEPIFKDLGYTYEGEIFSQDQYKKIIFGWSRDDFSFGGFFKNARQFEARVAVNQTFTDNDLINYSYTTRGLYGWGGKADSIYPANALYVPKGWDDRDFICDFVADFKFVVNSGNWILRIRRTVTGLNDFVIESETFGPGSYSHVLTAKETLVTVWNGSGTQEQWHVELGTSGVGPHSITILQGSRFYNIVDNKNQEAVTPKFLLQEILPDMKQEDLLIDFTMRFGILWDIVGKHIICRRIEDVIAGRYGVANWQNKQVEDGAKPISYDTDFAQVNKFTYVSTDPLYVNGSGDGSIDVPNNNLKEEEVIYNSPIWGTVTALISDSVSRVTNAARVLLHNAQPAEYPTKDNELAFDNPAGIRLLYVKDNGDTKPIQYGGQPQTTDYLVAYFSGGPYNMNYQEFIERNYNRLRRALQIPRTIPRRFNLTPADIGSYSPFKLVFNNNSYYLAEEIKEYRKGVPTQVTLFKVL